VSRTGVIVAAVAALAVGTWVAVALTPESPPAPQAQVPALPRPGGAVDPPGGVQDTEPASPSGGGAEAVSEDGSTAEDLADEELAAVAEPADGQWSPPGVDSQVEGLSGPEETAARFVLGLHTWDWQQPEADRVAQLRALAAPTVQRELLDRQERWDDIDEVREFAGETSVAVLSSVQTEGPVEFGAIPVRVGVLAIEESNYGLRERRELIEVHIRGTGGRYVVDSMHRY